MKIPFVVASVLAFVVVIMLTTARIVGTDVASENVVSILVSVIIGLSTSIFFIVTGVTLLRIVSQNKGRKEQRMTRVRLPNW